jgi:phosphatidate cytidylyltransferase
MLAQRIATALVLLFVMIATLWSRDVWPFALLMLVMVLACAWEWGRLAGLGQGASIGLTAVTGAVIVATVVRFGIPARVTPGLGADAVSTAWWLAAATWGIGLVLVVRIGVAGWQGAPLALRVGIGVAILVLTWWAIVMARAIGVNFLLSTMAVIWASDIAAYFGGKAWGGRFFGPRKLAPSISPGKTWEGAVSGLVGALLVSLLWVVIVDRTVPVDGPSLQGLLVERLGWVAMLLAVVVITVAGILGDLFESLVKRAAGAKDSSRLLPGHGGVLDRVDALLPVLPIAIALAHLKG